MAIASIVANTRASTTWPPKSTEIDVGIDADRTTARVANDAGGTDLALSVATPAQTRYPTGQRVSSLTSYTSINGDWHSTFSQTNVLSAGTVRFPRNIDLQTGTGGCVDTTADCGVHAMACRFAT